MDDFFKQSTFLKMANLLGHSATRKYSKFLGIYPFVNNIISILDRNLDESLFTFKKSN